MLVLQQKFYSSQFTFLNYNLSFLQISSNFNLGFQPVAVVNLELSPCMPLKSYFLNCLTSDSIKFYLLIDQYI